MFSLRPKIQDTAFKVHRSISSVADILDHQIGSYGDRACIRYDTGSSYRSVDFSGYADRVRSMVRYFQSEGAEGKVVMTLCKNRLEWDMVSLSVFHTANILYPLDTKTNPVEMDHLLSFGKPDYVLVARAQLERVRDLQARLGFVAKILVADLHHVFEDEGLEPGAPRPGEFSMREISDKFMTDSVIRSSPRLADPDTVLGHYATSGTTSLPKIVRVTHGNIVAEVNCAVDVINLRPNEDLLNIGPYTHIATLVEFLVTKTLGFTVTYFTREPDDDDVLEDEIEKMRREGIRVKALMAVPKFWIYLMKEVLEEMKDKPVLRGLYENIAAIEKHGNLHDLGTIEKAKLTAVRILLRNKLGGYFSYGISSSTKLDGAVVEIFGKLGITVLDIYGATECSGIISRNRLNEVLPGTCGKLIDELDWKISEPRTLPGTDRTVGLLEVRGAPVARGYLTADGEEPLPVDADGWLSTGDLAWIDADRTVHLVGRQKELVVWKDGTYLDPQYLSNLLVRSIFVKDAMVAHVQPDDPKLSVFLYPDWQRIRKNPTWKSEIATGLTEGQALKRRMVEAIRYAESIAKITAEMDKETVWILPRKLERTPTHKIKFLFERQRLHEAEALR